MIITKSRVVFASVLLGVGVAIAVASLFGEPEWRLSYTVKTPASREVLPLELASWIIEGRRDFTVVDMRDEAAYAKGHVRGAVHCGACHASPEEGAESQRGDSFVDLSKKVVLYTETGTEGIEVPKVLHDNPQLLRLGGGYAAWQRHVLAPVRFDGLADGAALDAAKRREAVRAYFAGEAVLEAPRAALPMTPIKRRAPHKSAAANEGC